MNKLYIFAILFTYSIGIADTPVVLHESMYLLQASRVHSKKFRYGIVPSESVVKVIHKVAIRHDIDEDVLFRIAFVESKFQTNATRKNSNGTMDVGLFQINSIHWKTTCSGLKVYRSIEDNAECAGRIVAGHAKFKGKDRHWFARYHSKTPERKLHYFNLLAKAIQE